LSPLNLAARLGQDEFLAQAFHRQYRHVSGAIENPASLMTWDALNTILATHRLDPPRLRLSMDGEMLPQYRYASPVMTRRHTVWQRLYPAELHARLAEGASLVLDAADELHAPIGRAAMELEQWLRAGVQANLYASWTPREGFGVHWDDHDVLVIQVDGAKRWKLYGQTRVAPMYKDTTEPDPPPSEPVAELVMQPGDLLYLPRGWWHSVSASEGVHSMHVTFGIQTSTGAQLLAWLADDLRSREVLRRDLPVHASGEEQAAYLHRLRAEVAAALEAPGLIKRFVSERDGEDLTRVRPNLPYITDIPADPKLMVRLATSRAELGAAADNGVVFRATDNEWDLTEEAGPVLRRLIDVAPGSVSLGELAGAAGISVDDTADLLSELAEGQAVTVEGSSS
jgi:Cupin superfamily protein